MTLTIHFLGTGTPKTRGFLSEGGFVIFHDKSTILVDPGQGAAAALARLKVKEVDIILSTEAEREHDAHLIKLKDKPRLPIIKEIKKGFLFEFSECSILYATQNLGSYPKSDTLILYGFHKPENTIKKMKPKLAIITGFSNMQEDPIYIARKIHKETGIQTISAKDDIVVDLSLYLQFQEQKALSQFRE